MSTSNVTQLLEGGKRCAAEGRFEEALTQFAQAAQLAPFDKQAFVQLGLLYKDLGDPQGAIDFWIRAAELDDSDAFIHLNIGLTYFQGRVYEFAQTHLGYAEIILEEGIALMREKAPEMPAENAARLRQESDALEATLHEVQHLLQHIEQELAAEEPAAEVRAA